MENVALGCLFACAGNKNNNRNGQMAENLFLWKLQLFFFVVFVSALRVESANVYILALSGFERFGKFGYT